MSKVDVTVIRLVGGGQLQQFMIEAFWRSLRHQWLCRHSLESVGQLEQLMGFYVREHNTKMPHHAFDEQTPNEV